MIDDALHGRFGLIVVAANEHGRLAALQLRIDHHRIADGIERLDEVRVRESGLQALHQRLIEIGEKLQHAVSRRRIGDRIGGVNYRFLYQVGRARGVEHIERHCAFDGEHHHFAELCRIGKTTDSRSLMLRDEVLELGGIAGAQNDLVPVLNEAAGEGFGHIARS